MTWRRQSCLPRPHSCGRLALEAADHPDANPQPISASHVGDDRFGSTCHDLVHYRRQADLSFLILPAACGQSSDGDRPGPADDVLQLGLFHAGDRFPKPVGQCRGTGASPACRAEAGAHPGLSPAHISGGLCRESKHAAVYRIPASDVLTCNSRWMAARCDWLKVSQRLRTASSVLPFQAADMMLSAEWPGPSSRCPSSWATT